MNPPPLDLPQIISTPTCCRLSKPKTMQAFKQIITLYCCNKMPRVLPPEINYFAEDQLVFSALIHLESMTDDSRRNNYPITVTLEEAT